MAHDGGPFLSHKFVTAPTEAAVPDISSATPGARSTVVDIPTLGMSILSVGDAGQELWTVVG